jgi:diacylglycerol kinase family enzyme
VARALLITNPVAARADPGSWERVARALERAGWQAEVAITRNPEDSRLLAEQGVTAGVDLVAVFGGDGTTMRAVPALLGTEIPLGLVPGGTGNLLAGNLRIPGDPLRAARVLTSGKRRRIDLGRVLSADGEHYFAVACGAGADARVMGGAATADKRRWGIGAYLASAFRELPVVRSSAATVSVDGRVIEANAALVMILNCGELIPPLVRVGTDIRPDDGALDLITIAADTPWQGLRTVFRVIVDGRRGAIRESPFVRYARGTRFTVDVAEPQPVQFDGEPAGVTPFSAEVVPGALTVIVPAD